MKAEIFCLAEGASVKNNQLCILHTLTAFQTEQIPVHVAAMVCIQLRFDQAEEGMHKCFVMMLDIDGRRVWQSDERLVNIRFGDDAGVTVSVVTTFLLQAVLLEGVHDLRLIVDGVELAETMLGIRKIIQK